MQRITTNISNSYMRLVRQRLHGLINPWLPLTLKMLSCIAILYCDFVIRNIVNTKMLKAMNQQTFLPSNYLDYMVLYPGSHFGMQYYLRVLYY